jgi:hypothetical protein
VTTIREVIDRDLRLEIQSVIKVGETGRLATDLREYVLTDQLAAEFAKVLDAIVTSARPAANGTGRIGIWVSGFFGSGKSHFAKVLGHLVADTSTDAGSARELFERHLRPGRPSDDRVAGLLQEATTYRLTARLIAFDITALQAGSTENVGQIFLRAFQRQLGLSSLSAYAERELDLQAAGQYEAFLQLYESKAKRSWTKDRDLGLASPLFAACLAELLPDRYPTAEIAHQSLELALSQLEAMTIADVVTRLLRWLDDRQGTTKDRQMLLFVADEVGAWAGRDLPRIEQVRTLVEQFAEHGDGRLWLLATSQERLSDVVQNTSALDARVTQEFIQRLEARFGVNVHLESREVGTVIEDRILRKRPKTAPELEQLWTANSARLQDIGESPGLELGGSYPTPSRERFVRDYPFLPYQLPLAADIFGAMRGVKVSNGARSMLKVAYEATSALADRPIGTLVSWDRVFDAANGENEFADENYLGTSGLASIDRADIDLGDKSPIERPSGLLKTLWLAQRTGRIPCTEANLARLLLDRIDSDVLAAQRDVADTLEALERLDYVRRDPASGQWRFLTPDEVTVEKIVTRIAGDVAQKQVRDEVHRLYTDRLKGLLPGRITLGKSNTVFRYGLFLNDSAIANDDAPVSVRVLYANSTTANRLGEEYAAYLETPVVYWSVPVPDRLEDRVRRILAIDGLQADPEFNRIKTARTMAEAERIRVEANQLREGAGQDVDRSLGRGTLYWGGGTADLEATASAKILAASAKVKLEEAVRDRLGTVYTRFLEGDRVFNTANIDKLLVAPPAQRAGLDPDLGIFDAEGHILSGHLLPTTLVAYLAKSTKSTGQDVADAFADPLFGWPTDLMRYVAVAMFVDGKVTFVDKSGTRYDNPKAPVAKGIIGTQAFKSTRLLVEEDPLKPEEITKIRALLADLGFKTADGSELTLSEVSGNLQTSLASRLGTVQRAHDAGLPLAATYDHMEAMLEAIGSAGSRANRLRSLLAHGDELRTGASALVKLETFIQSHGLEQYRRSEQLMTLVLQAGLTEDPKWGEVVVDAREQMAALKEQRRVLDEWEAAYRGYRGTIIDAAKATYRPLRDEAKAGVELARASILDGPEFARLSLSDATKVRMEFFAQGRPLEEIPDASMQSDADLIAASGSFSMSHLRLTLAALDTQAALARARVAELLDKGQPQKAALWSASTLAGRILTTDTEVDAAFDSAKDDVKALVRDHKSVRIV